MNGKFGGWLIGTFAAWLAIFFFLTILLWTPLIGPWTAHREGMANLARAEQDRQILVQQAKAERDAANLRAEAIAILGQKTKEFPEYRQQEFIGAFADSLAKCDTKLIYVPTEAGIPIIERKGE